MVGPGDVDNDLEPEVKDECNTKYGDVIKVLIHEVRGIICGLFVKVVILSVFSDQERRSGGGSANICGV